MGAGLLLTGVCFFGGIPSLSVASPRWQWEGSTRWLNEPVRRTLRLREERKERLLPSCWFASVPGVHPLRACWGHSVIAVVTNDLSRLDGHTDSFRKTHSGQGEGRASLSLAEKRCLRQENQAHKRVAGLLCGSCRRGWSGRGQRVSSRGTQRGRAPGRGRTQGWRKFPSLSPLPNISGVPLLGPVPSWALSTQTKVGARSLQERTGACYQVHTER